VGEVIVLDANDGAANHQYESNGAGAPFSTGGGCIGNNDNLYNDITCNFYLNHLVQPNPGSITPIIFVTSHYPTFSAAAPQLT
jgi:hypothetical protein